MYQNSIKMIWGRLLAVALLLLALPVALPVAQAEEEFLTPDAAFRIHGEPARDGKVRVTWQIAENYYLYRSKFRFSTETPGITLGFADFPEPQIKDDQIFGRVEIYRDQVTADIPLELADNAPEVVTIQARSQGCADAGLCYPPHTQTVLVAVSDLADRPAVDPRMVEDVYVPGTNAAADVAASHEPVFPEDAEFDADPEAAGGEQDALAELGQELGGGFEFDDGIIPVEQAFVFQQPQIVDGQTLRLRWDIADGTYLYSDKIKLAIEGEGVALGEPAWPKPKIKHNSITPEGEIGDVPVYVHAIDLTVPLQRASAEAVSATLGVKFQGCAERGICYPPVTKKTELELPAISGAAVFVQVAQPASEPAVEAASTVATEDQGAETPLSEQDEFLRQLSGASVPMAVLFSLLFGILVAFTACMYPMIPILSSIIVGQGEKVTTAKAFSLSLSYVVGMALVFAAIGGVIGLFGKVIGVQAAFQSPWVLVPAALLFAGLALSMFGFYEIQVPSAIQSRLNSFSNKQEGGSLIGAGLMGAISALIVGPCGGPVLLAMLAYASLQGAVMGFFSLFIFGMGMGLPLLLFGATGGSALPRAGAWMDTVKAVAGVILLGLAVLFLERLAPTYLSLSLIMLMWGTLLIVAAVYMGALKSLSIEAGGWEKLWKGLGLVLLIYGTTFIVGVAMGGKDTLQPLRGIGGGHGGGAAASEHLTFKKIKSVDDLERELAQAKNAGRPVMLDFYADWCLYCKQMERDTFPAPAVQEALRDFVILQADVTAQDDQDKALQDSVSVAAPPAILFWSSVGEELRAARIVGYKGPDDFSAHVKQAVP